MAKWEYKLIRIGLNQVPTLEGRGKDRLNDKLNALIQEGWEIVESNLRNVRADEPIVILLRRERAGTIGFSREEE
ncbi:MAG: hypothetical protein DRP95_04000 [Candidatus Latescibacterota bacterium]|nr:MAG: hypothetical protein DRP95_04000 [Candidatus Latescibacterota bacterium]